MSLYNSIRLNPLYPRLVGLVWKLSLEVSFDLDVVQGLRTYSEQDMIYAKGRTIMSDVSCTHNGVSRKPGTCPVHPLGATVTNARGGYSWHNFGVAVDLAPMTITHGIDWNASHPQWREMEQKGTALGLTSGAYWQRLVDAPHFQITGDFPVAAPTDAVRAIVDQGNQTIRDQGLKAFWLVVDKHYKVDELKPTP